MVTKILEKISIIVGMLFLTLFLALAFEVLKRPESIVSFIAYAVAILFLGGIFLVLLLWILRLLSAILIMMWTTVLSFFEGIHNITYKWYLSLSDICAATFERIDASGNKTTNRICCCFYLLLRGLNRLLIGFLSISLILTFTLSGALVIGSLVSMQLTIRSTFGIGLLTFLGKSQPFYIVYGVVMYLAVMAAVILVLLSLGSECHEWSKELRMTYEEYSKSLAKIQSHSFSAEDVYKESSAGEAGAENVETGLLYLRNLEGHIQGAQALALEVETALVRKDHALLRTIWSEYLTSLSDLSKTCSSYKQGIPVDKFKRLIPFIQKLEKQREEILALTIQIKKDFDATPNASYFAGCDTDDKLEKRYKDLCKVFHPDMSNGDEETFKIILSEYEKLKETVTK